MSDFDSNPFADPEAGNPFQDPSVRQATQPGAPPRGLDDYNPFADGGTAQSKTGAPQQPTTQAVHPPQPSQPAVMQPTEQPPAYTPSAAQPATDDLQRRQEELERKAAELQKKEEEMRNLQYNTRANNFPPLPKCCPVQPCFYQDFSVDIPLEFQRIVKALYISWMVYVLLLILNVLVSLAFFCTGADYGGATFGVSILYLVLFTPCSFVCWYRPVYKAFRSDSSFNFFVFFFIFFFQFIWTILLAIGIPGWGACGFINGLSIITRPFVADKVIGALVIIFGFIWGLAALGQFILLVKVVRIYRSTGASFEKAQAEFASGIMSNKNVQNAAAGAATAAARNAMQPGANKY